MTDGQVPEPDWRRAQSYEPLLAADPATWAWEFARRAPLGVEVEPEAPGELCFAGSGPAGDPVPAVLWHDDPGTPSIDASPTTSSDPAGFDIEALPLPVLVIGTDDGDQHVLVCDGRRRLRLTARAGGLLSGPVACRFVLPPRDAGPGVLTALAGLITLRDTGRLKPVSTNTPAQAMRWLESLRAHDARSAGASQREIAVALFGERRVAEDWNGSSDYMRMRVHRLLGSAEKLVAGGWRALVGLRPREARAHSRIVAEWRSPAWRDSGLRTLSLLGAIFVTTCLCAGSLRDVCSVL